MLKRSGHPYLNPIMEVTIGVFTVGGRDFGPDIEHLGPFE